jgi:hypothetical protein
LVTNGADTRFATIIRRTVCYGCVSHANGILEVEAVGADRAALTVVDVKGAVRYSPFNAYGIEL